VCTPLDLRRQPHLCGHSFVSPHDKINFSAAWTLFSAFRPSFSCHLPQAKLIPARYNIPIEWPPEKPAKHFFSRRVEPISGFPRSSARNGVDIYTTEAGSRFLTHSR
jgi:hypothetical protein